VGSSRSPAATRGTWKPVSIRKKYRLGILTYTWTDPHDFRVIRWKHNRKVLALLCKSLECSHIHDGMQW
jgi:hypothetical protein